ncbi:MAG: hypothetical protein RMY34_23320 [Aulosira sp. DedQUE10]|nr:hypothetical protein [Aulosira sp. DedQUE10]
MGVLCKLCRLPADVREPVDEMLDQGLPASAVQSWLEGQGVEVSVSAIGRHKRAHLGLLARNFDFVGLPPDDAPSPLPLAEYSRRMSGYLQTLSLNQSRYIQDRQEACLQDHQEPDIDKPVVVLTRLVSLANMFMGFASTASLDAAIEVLRSAGYELKGNEVQAQVNGDQFPTLAEVRAWRDREK